MKSLSINSHYCYKAVHMSLIDYILYCVKVLSLWHILNLDIKSEDVFTS